MNDLPGYLTKEDGNQGCGAGARAGVPAPVPADILGFPKRHMRRPNVPAK
jgi:hypothetical protein